MPTPTPTIQGTQLLEALDGLVFGRPIKHVPDGHNVKAVPAADGQQFGSLREAYIAITGDRHLTGKARECVNLAWFNNLPRFREALTVASWGEILGDSIRRAMLADYAVPSYLDDWRKIVSTISEIKDFRTNRRMRYGGYGDLSTVAEGGTYNALTSPTDEEVTFGISKKGGTEKVTLEMIANDDVQAIRRIPIKLARAAKRTLYKAVFDPLNNNANIYTGTALALAGQTNISTTALSRTEVLLGAAKMRKQTPYNLTSEPLNFTPKTLIVPADLEELGFRLTALPIAETTAQNATEPAFLRRLRLDQLITMPYWTDTNNWWLVADPAEIPTIEVGFFRGQQEPELFVQDDSKVGSQFDTDETKFKVRFVFGVVVLDYRGFFGGIV